MTTTTLRYPERQARIAARLADYLELTKPKIALLELVTLATAAVLAGCESWRLLHALVGTALVAAGASALNQWWEADRDVEMERTRGRPLPAGRMERADALRFGLATSGCGLVYLVAFVNVATASLGLLTLLLYVVVYTPLKRFTPANTTVGAVAGALPVWMGVAAMDRSLDLRTGALLLVVFLWQFPHFAAIAWIYRRQYGAAGMKMLSVVDPSGLRAASQAVVVSLVLVPVSLVPALLPLTGSVLVYAVWALALGILQATCAVLFLVRRDEAAARRLLRASLVYLPGLLAALLIVTPT